MATGANDQAMKVGIVGLGFRLGYLARVFSAKTPDFQIVGYVDPEPAGLPYARQYGISVGKAYASLEDLWPKKLLIC